MKMKKFNILIAAVAMVFATVNLSAQSKSCSMSYEECAAKMGITVEQCKKICAANGMTTAALAEGETRVASASTERIVDLPACCYGAFTETGKACCEEYQTALASADKLVDADGNEFAMKKCAKSSKSCAKSCASKSAKTQVASVVMVREAVAEDIPVIAKSQKSCKKSCSKSCKSKTTKA